MSIAPSPFPDDWSRPPTRRQVISDLSGSRQPAPHEADLTPRVYTPEEAATVLRMSRSSLYAALRSGEIASVRIGGSRRIPIAVIDALLDIEGGEDCNVAA